jgi:hypothetical protein
MLHDMVMLPAEFLGATSWATCSFPSLACNRTMQGTSNEDENNICLLGQWSSITFVGVADE